MGFLIKKEVARLLFLGEGTVREYFRSYIEEGEEEFLKFHYSGKPAQLTKNQLDQLSEFVEKTNPSSCSPVAFYILQTFKVHYTLSAVTALLNRLGFTYKKPKLIPGKTDPIAQEKFLQELEELEEKLEKDDRLLYMDGVHPQHNSKPAYGWFKKGKEHFLKANTGRKRININGALDVDHFEMTYRFDDTINAQSTIKLFEEIEKRYSKANRIVVVCDNACYYRSSLVSKHLEKSRIELKFLPPYSPNLNLIERLWLFMNKKVRNNKYYEKFKEFQAAIYGFFENIPSYRSELKNLLRKKFCVYNF